MQPDILLLDEPFGALDALTRSHLQDSLMEIKQELNNTVIMVTHDVDEAVLLSDRIVMMTNGPKAGIGEVLEIDFERPRDRKSIMDDPLYYEYREHLISFLEERADIRGVTHHLSKEKGTLRGFAEKTAAA